MHKVVNLRTSEEQHYDASISALQAVKTAYALEHGQASRLATDAQALFKSIDVESGPRFYLCGDWSVRK